MHSYIGPIRNLRPGTGPSFLTLPAATASPYNQTSIIKCVFSGRRTPPLAAVVGWRRVRPGSRNIALTALTSSHAGRCGRPFLPVPRRGQRNPGSHGVRIRQLGCGVDHDPPFPFRDTGGEFRTAERSAESQRRQRSRSTVPRRCITEFGMIRSDYRDLCFC